ncbi:unnamed protein product, partial [Musa banksii]
DGRQLWNSLRASPSLLPFHAFDTVEVKLQGHHAKTQKSRNRRLYNALVGS